MEGFFCLKINDQDVISVQNSDYDHFINQTYNMAFGLAYADQTIKTSC